MLSLAPLILRLNDGMRQFMQEQSAPRVRSAGQPSETVAERELPAAAIRAIEFLFNVGGTVTLQRFYEALQPLGPSLRANLCPVC